MTLDLLEEKRRGRVNPLATILSTKDHVTKSLKNAEVLISSVVVFREVDASSP